MVCYDVQVEQALQPITGEEPARGTTQAPDARLDVHYGVPLRTKLYRW